MWQTTINRMDRQTATMKSICLPWQEHITDVLCVCYTMMIQQVEHWPHTVVQCSLSPSAIKIDSYIGWWGVSDKGAKIYLDGQCLYLPAAVVDFIWLWSFFTMYTDASIQMVKITQTIPNPMWMVYSQAIKPISYTRGWAEGLHHARARWSASTLRLRRAVDTDHRALAWYNPSARPLMGEWLCLSYIERNIKITHRITLSAWQYLPLHLPVSPSPLTVSPHAPPPLYLPTPLTVSPTPHTV